MDIQWNVIKCLSGQGKTKFELNLIIFLSANALKLLNPSEARKKLDFNRAKKLIKLGQYHDSSIHHVWDWFTERFFWIFRQLHDHSEVINWPEFGSAWPNVSEIWGVNQCTTKFVINPMSLYVARIEAISIEAYTYYVNENPPYINAMFNWVDKPYNLKGDP